ncbi:hypothetical protein QYE76_027459 [Lolium multiflorum]|uniref:Uncharacterized protein n=1 Tax=Lolium multiflorum TaxID=4521 RepID=A0AAD8VG23_LOLMU|nr:hypothetical protein QYE76_027459 [Lolium multiflorum]
MSNGSSPCSLAVLWAGLVVGVSAYYRFYGAHIPAVVRTLISCGWFGIESWISGRAIFLLLPARLKMYALLMPLRQDYANILSFSAAQLALAVIMRGMDDTRKLEKYSTPVHVALTSVLLPINSQHTRHACPVYLPALAAAQVRRLCKKKKKSGENFVFTLLLGNTTLMGRALEELSWRMLCREAHGDDVDSAHMVLYHQIREAYGIRTVYELI